MSEFIPAAAQAWRELQATFGRYTFQEVASMITTTSGAALPILVSARAAYQMLTKVDTRNFCRLESVPPGTGKQFLIQNFVAVAGGTGTEGDAATDTGETETTTTFTLGIYNIRTDVSDLYQRQSAISIADAVGKLHGNAMVREVNNKVYTQLRTNSTSKQTIVDSGNTEQEISWGDILTAIRLVEDQRFEPDTLVTAPKKLYELMLKDIASQVYMGAYSDFLRSGRVPLIAGLNVYADRVYEPANHYTGTAGEKYAHVLVADESIGWATAWDVNTEIQRVAEATGFKMVTTLAGDGQLVLEKSIASIEHA